MRRNTIVTMCLLCMVALFPLQAQEDPYLWLEEIDGNMSLEWVREHNKKSISQLEAVPGFKELNGKLLEIYNSNQRIPYASYKGDYLYGYWTDGQQVRGVLRRTTMDEYGKENTKWETVLDLDALAEEEGENWVYKHGEWLIPGYDRRFIRLSRGGGDKTVFREFDVNTKSFVKDGFNLPEGKSFMKWRDKDSVFVSADFGEGTLSRAGYPRIVKLWKRGTRLKDAATVFEAPTQYIMAGGGRFHAYDDYLDVIFAIKSGGKIDSFLYENGETKKIPIPEDAKVTGYLKKQLIITLGSDWKVENKTYEQGSVLICALADIMAGKTNFKLLIKDGQRLIVDRITTTQNAILVTVMENVIKKVFIFTQNESGEWKKSRLKTPLNVSAGVRSADCTRDDYFIKCSNFLYPSSLCQASVQTGKIKRLKQLPHFFDASLFQVKQYEAVSADGTLIPYFVVMGKDIELDGNNPTIMYGYGGFGKSKTPKYSAKVGYAWLSKGGVYVYTNIRGGGEFGPQWHKAAIKKNRRKSYEDFIGIAEDLFKRKITNPSKLGIMGGSNGGLLVGAVVMMRPDLCKAAVSSAPVLDMKRYSILMSGSCWLSEYGDPDDPEMWEYIKTYSPYHNVKKGVKYPRIFFLTSTGDDRVHPAHARKMTALMESMGNNVFYYENTEGGHAGAANKTQYAYRDALTYSYFYKMLMDE